MFEDSRLHTDPLSLPPVAVACCDGSMGLHVAVTYRKGGQPRFIDQAWHRVQRAKPLADLVSQFKGKIVFGSPGIDDERALAVSGLCRAIEADILAKTSHIAYSFQFDNNALFDVHTGKLAMPSGKGLTCVTYALVVFRSARVPLIDFDGWGQRPEDQKKHEELVELLKDDVDAEHLKTLKAEVRCVRCRPEEICGACACIEEDSEGGVKFGEASAAGLRVLALLGTLPATPAPAAATAQPATPAPTP